MIVLSFVFVFTELIEIDGCVIECVAHRWCIGKSTFRTVVRTWRCLQGAQMNISMNGRQTSYCVRRLRLGIFQIREVRVIIEIHTVHCRLNFFVQLMSD